MKLEDARTAYEVLSGKASDITRQLALAGVGLIWLFRTESHGDSLNWRLLRAALFIFSALFCDLLQYLLGTGIWFLFFRHKEKQGTGRDVQFSAPAALNLPTWVLFYLKTALMLWAYAVYIIPFLMTKFWS